MDASPETLLTVHRLSQMTRVHPSTILRLVSQQRIPVEKFVELGPDRRAPLFRVDVAVQLADLDTPVTNIPATIAAAIH
jgi:hypothetical protein